jgi:hypothetical protein
MIRVFKGWKECSVEYKTKLAVADNSTPSVRPYCDLSDSHRRIYRLATEEFHMPGSHVDGEGQLNMDKHRFLLDTLADMPSEALEKVMLLVMEQFPSTAANAFLEHAGGLDRVGNELVHHGYMQAVSALHVDTAEAANLYFMTYISHDAWDMFASSFNRNIPNSIKFSR